MAMPVPRRTQNRNMLRDGNDGDAHAQRASHYHCFKRTPEAKRESNRGWWLSLKSDSNLSRLSDVILTRAIAVGGTLPKCIDRLHRCEDPEDVFRAGNPSQ